MTLFGQVFSPILPRAACHLGGRNGVSAHARNKATEGASDAQRDSAPSRSGQVP